MGLVHARDEKRDVTLDSSSSRGSEHHFLAIHTRKPCPLRRGSWHSIFVTAVSRSRNLDLIPREGNKLRKWDGNSRCFPLHFKTRLNRGSHYRIIICAAIGVSQPKTRTPVRWCGCAFFVTRKKRIKGVKPSMRPTADPEARNWYPA